MSSQLSTAALAPTGGTSRSKSAGRPYDIALFTVAVGATVAFRNEGPVYDVAKGAALLLMTTAALRGVGRGILRDSRIPLGLFALAAIVVLALSAVVSSANAVALRAWFDDAVAPLAIAMAPFAAVTVAESASQRAVEFTLAATGLVAATSYALYWRETRGLVEPGAAAGLASWYVPLGAGVFFAARSPRGAQLSRFLLVGIIIALLIGSGSRLAVIPVSLLCGWLLVRPVVVEASRAARWRLAAGAASMLLVAAVLLAVTGLARGPGTERFLSSFDLLESGLAEDLSFQERARQTAVAMAAFDASPLLGVGPGYTYEWTTPTGLHKRSPIAESPAGVIADFGLIGAATLAALIAAIAARSWSRLRSARRGRWRSPADEALLVVCLAAAVNAAIASPFDDKGLAIVLVLLLARSFQSSKTLVRAEHFAPHVASPHRSGVVAATAPRATFRQSAPASPVTPPIVHLAL
jgi:O-antigen ligase